jgi:SAM-dependent methyltransferase
MGISLASAEFLVQCRREGVSFGATLTLGRQHLFASPFQLEALLRSHGCWPDDLQRQDFLDRLTANPYYADSFLRALGAERLSSLDASTYEGADIVHDLGLPIPNHLQRSFDVVIDGGLLEHVFNFPAALKNAMELVRVGGHLILMTPANNYFGHGFYQFSPELFFRALSPENGFRVERMLALENDLHFATVLGVPYVNELKGRWYEVTDPASLGTRVTLTNNRPLLLFIRARCVACRPVFAQYPQQSDYVATWETASHDASAPSVQSAPVAAARHRWLTRPTRLHLKFHLLPALLRRLNPFHQARLYRAQTLRNRAFFRKLKAARSRT